MAAGGSRFPSPKSEALKPMLWYLAVTLLPVALTAFSGRETVTYVLLGFAGLGVLSFLAAYWWLLIRHPDRLQSEAYMTRLYGDQRKGRRVLEEPVEPPM
jgi:hypothetical protein